jgi:hypothetical protein
VSFPARLGWLACDSRFLLSRPICRGSLLLPSGTFQIFSAARVKANIKYLKVFQKDDAANGIDSWKKAVGRRLRYSATELRKNIERATGVSDRMCELVTTDSRKDLCSSQDPENLGSIRGWETFFCRSRPRGGSFRSSFLVGNLRMT